jgi:hypothetical protein
VPGDNEGGHEIEVNYDDGGQGQDGIFNFFVGFFM